MQYTTNLTQSESTWFAQFSFSQVCVGRHTSHSILLSTKPIFSPLYLFHGHFISISCLPTVWVARRPIWIPTQNTLYKHASAVYLGTPLFGIGSRVVARLGIINIIPIRQCGAAYCSVGALASGYSRHSSTGEEHLKSCHFSDHLPYYVCSYKIAY